MADTNANDDGEDEPQPFVAWDEAGTFRFTRTPADGLFVDLVVDEDLDEADVPPGWVTMQLVAGQHWGSTDGEFRFTRD